MDTVSSPSFARLLKRYRLAAGLTQEALAERANLSVRTVSDLERGLKTRPHRDTVELLTTALQLAPGDRVLLEGAIWRRRGSQVLLAGSLASTPPGRLEASQRPTARATIQLTLLVGRESELGQLRAGLEEALAGRGRLFLLSGEPGIGKTRLAEALVREAGAQGALVAWSHGWEEGGAPAYWLWVQVIRALKRAHDPTTWDALKGSTAAPIARIVPEAFEPNPATVSPPISDSEHARFEFFDAVTALLQHVAASRATVIVLDDLHAVDAASLLLLRFLAPELRDAPLLVLGTYRDVGVEVAPSVARLLAQLDREGQRIPLSGLKKGDVGRFIEETAGAQADDRLVASLHETTGGNPFFVHAVLRLSSSEAPDRSLDQLLPAGFRIPEGVREAIRRWVDQLSEGTRDVLWPAAVIGREFSFSLLRDVCDLPAEWILGILAESVRAGVLREVPNHVGQYTFVHGLFRETLYEDLGMLERVRWHQRVGEAMEARYRDDLDPHLAQLAHHLLQAAQAGETERAIDYSARAGDRAMRLLAYEEAADHFTHAFDAMEMSDEVDQGRRCELLLELGDAQWAAGEIGNARKTFTQAAEIARGLGSLDQLVRAVVSSGGIHDEWMSADLHMVSLLEGTLSALGDKDSMQKAKVLARLAVELLGDSAGLQRRVSLATEAVVVARRLDDAATLTYALGAQHQALWVPEALGRRLEAATELVTIAKSTGDRRMELEGRLWRLADLLELGDTPRFDAEIEVYARLAEELNRPVDLAFATAMKGRRALMDGRFEEAERLIRQAYALRQRARFPRAEFLYHAQLRFLLWEQGRQEELEESQKILLEFVGARHRTAFRFWFETSLAQDHIIFGRKEEARAEFERVLATDPADLPRGPFWIPMLVCLSEVCAFLGDARQAERLYPVLLPYADHNVLLVTGTPYLGSASHYLGLLATTMARWQEAQAHFESALAFNRKLGARVLVAHTEYRYAQMLLRRGKPGERERALDLLDRTGHTAEQLGMRPLQEQVSALAAAARGHGAAPVSTQPDDPPPVTAFRQEGEYWMIAYGGIVSRLRDSKGLGYIARLLAHPNREFHALDLLALGRADAPERSASSIPEELTVRRESDAGDILDLQARAAYKGRLKGLREEIEEAERFHDLERAAHARQEMEFLVAELARAAGLGGRGRRAGSAAERARVSVTRAIRAALQRITAVNPPLGEHLARTIRTGTFCSYSAESHITL